MSLSVARLNVSASSWSRRDPHGERAHDFGPVEADLDRDRHDLEHAIGVGPEAAGLASGKGLLDFRQRAHRAFGDVDVAGFGQHASILAGQHDQRCTQRSAKLLLVGAREWLDRWRVAGVDGGLQPGVIGDEPGHDGERLQKGGALLIDQRARFDEPALQARLRPVAWWYG
jgi:hypothetical protein